MLALLLLAEGTMRCFYGPPQYMGGMPYDPDVGFRLRSGMHFELSQPVRPYTYYTSTDGFRGPELPGAGNEPSRGKTRLLFVGDSFLSGEGVPTDALIPFSCETELRARGHDVEAFNVSYPGMSTATELILFRKHVARVQPEVVVLVLYSGNDIVDNTPELVGVTTVSQGAYVRPFLVSNGDGGLETMWLNPLRAVLRRWSRLYQRLEVRLLTAGLIQDPTSPDLVPPQDELLAAGRLPRTFLELLLPPEPGDPWEAGWRRTDDLLRAFRREVEAARARFILTSAPLLLQVEKDAQSFALDAVLRAAKQPLLDERVDWNLPEEHFAAFTRSEDIDYVPLLDALRAATLETRRSQYLKDWHLSARGHRVAGRVVAEALEQVLGGGALPSHESRSTVPIDLLDEAFVAEGCVDFTEDMRPEVLLWGWRSWRSVGKAGGGGWSMTTRQAGLVVPLRRGALLVKGWADRPKRKVSLRLSGHRATAPRSVREGPFLLKVPIRDAVPEGETAGQLDVIVTGGEPDPESGIVVTGFWLE